MTGGGNDMYVNFNHPPVGKILKFDIKVVHVRAATSKELMYGHIHDSRALRDTRCTRHNYLAEPPGFR